MPPRPEPVDLIIDAAGGFAVGSLEWSGVVRALLRHLSFPRDDLTASGVQRARAWLVRAETAAPAQYATIFEEFGIEWGLLDPGGDGLEEFFNLADILNQASGGQLEDAIRNIQETIDRTVTEVTNITETGTTTIGQQTSIFVDVPTPEEVLNDFRTAVSTYADQLFQAGDIGRETRSFLMSNPNFLLPTYLGILGERAANGENIFEIVGLDFELIPIEQIGERIGPGFQQQVTETLERIETGTLTIEELIQQVQNNLLSGEGSEDLQQTIQETINRITNQDSTRTTTEQIVSNLLQLTVENIFQRPNLTTVFAFSPTDFLRERFTPSALENLAAFIPGQQQAEQQFAQGITPSAPRRLA